MGGALWEWCDQALWNRMDASRPFMGYGGDFEMCLTTISSASMESSSRSPDLSEVCRSQEGISVDQSEPVDLERGIQSGSQTSYAFTNLDALDIAWTVTEDGTEIDSGRLQSASVAPGESATISISIGHIDCRAGAEHIPRVAFLLASRRYGADAALKSLPGSSSSLRRLPRP